MKKMQILHLLKKLNLKSRKMKEGTQEPEPEQVENSLEEEEEEEEEEEKPQSSKPQKMLDEEGTPWERRQKRRELREQNEGGRQ